MQLAISALTTDGIAVVSLTGVSRDTLREEDLLALHESLLVSPTILDLTDLTLAEPFGLTALLSRLPEQHRQGVWCVVAGRPAVRTALRLETCTGAWVFATVADALQAWRMQLEGYGPGWTVAAAGPTAPST